MTQTANTLLVLLALLCSSSVAAVSLQKMAEEADLIAIAIVEQVDYEKTRSFPSSGSAYLRILIPYQGARAGQWIEVKEQGLEDNACYYPEPDPFRFEGARFLVMLRADPKEEDVFRGIAPTCMIPVLVTQDNSYAVLHPVPGLDLPEEAVESMQFADPAAIVDAGDFTRAQLEELRETYQAKKLETGDYAPDTQRYIYTRGIPLRVIREMLGLTVERRPTPVQLEVEAATPEDS